MPVRAAGTNALERGRQQIRGIRGTGRGTLQLRAATLSARRGDAAGTADWMGEAGELAERTGETRDYALAFGPLNVQLHKLSAAGDQDDHDTALSVAADVTLPDDYPPTRAAHFHIDKAREQAWTARPDEALESLKNARRASAQLTRYHQSVHETVVTLLRARQRASDDLRDYTVWCGVLAQRRHVVEGAGERGGRRSAHGRRVAGG